MADKRRMKGKKRRPGGQYLIDKPKQPKPTSFDNIGMSLRCIECERIFNGPHKGEKIKRFSTESRALLEEGERLGYAQPGASDGLCSRRSCIEANNRRVVGELRQMHEGRDSALFDEMEQRMNQEQFEVVRGDKDRYPEGLIDDVEPHL